MKRPSIDEYYLEIAKAVSLSLTPPDAFTPSPASLTVLCINFTSSTFAPHFGHGTSIVSTIGLAFWHSGYPGHAKNFPYFPYFHLRAKI